MRYILERTEKDGYSTNGREERRTQRGQPGYRQSDSGAVQADNDRRDAEGARSIFKDVIVQRCIVHLIRNSIKYIPSKVYKAYTAQIKRVYGAPSLKAAEAEFERFKQAWNQYPGAIDVGVRTVL